MTAQRRVAIMQPYFLPYIGYWQLMHSVDVFVIYDNIEYTKRGWINRNRYLLDGRVKTFTLPLQKDSDYLDIIHRRLADNFIKEKAKLINRLESVYKKAPYFEEGRLFLHDVFDCDDTNLFRFIYHSIEKTRRLLGLSCSLVVSSLLDVPRGLKGQDRVIETCQQLGATEYINPIGGTTLYDQQAFRQCNIRLFFQQVRPIEYSQFDHPFIPSLSIIDSIMFLGSERLVPLLSEHDLITTPSN